MGFCLGAQRNGKQPQKEDVRNQPSLASSFEPQSMNTPHSQFMEEFSQIIQKWKQQKHQRVATHPGLQLDKHPD